MNRMSCRWGKKPILYAFILFLGVCSFAPWSSGQETRDVKYGMGFLWGFKKDLDRPVDHFAFLPRVTKSLGRNWEGELEGNFSYFGIANEKNLLVLGANGNVMFKPIQGKWGSLFLLAGGGLGYDNSNGKVREIGDTHLAGILQTGAGFNLNLGKRWALRGEYRFHHVSEPFDHDSGINTHNFILGFAF